MRSHRLAKPPQARRLLLFVAAGCTVALLVGVLVWRFTLQPPAPTVDAGPAITSTQDPAQPAQRNSARRSTDSAARAEDNAQFYSPWPGAAGFNSGFTTPRSRSTTSGAQADTGIPLVTASTPGQSPVPGPVSPNSPGSQGAGSRPSAPTWGNEPTSPENSQPQPSPPGTSPAPTPVEPANPGDPSTPPTTDLPEPTEPVAPTPTDPTEAPITAPIDEPDLPLVPGDPDAPTDPAKPVSEPVDPANPADPDAGTDAGTEV